ncbi:hypothetical protein OV287_14395 [Archangium sp. miwbw1]|uniref:Uncharacterized protein n=1 Tax=Archangium lansingense TaxID=2995310 RepID=A0ABT4A225_9BACT|nr:hypothetical protein [Archangium lansinium]MCY1075668.1 hypothetical protein [Archangium lansinium]
MTVSKKRLCALKTAVTSAPGTGAFNSSTTRPDSRTPATSRNSTPSSPAATPCRSPVPPALSTQSEYEPASSPSNVKVPSSRVTARASTGTSPWRCATRDSNCSPPNLQPQSGVS